MWTTALYQKMNVGTGGCLENNKNSTWMLFHFDLILFLFLHIWGSFFLLLFFILNKVALSGIKMHKIIKRKEKRTNYPVINGERSSYSGKFCMLNNFPQQTNGKDIVDVRFQNTFSNFNYTLLFFILTKTTPVDKQQHLKRGNYEN